MKRLYTCFGIAMCLFITGCAKNTDTPPPETLYDAVAGAAGLTEMVRYTPEELAGLTGIEPDEYSAIAAYVTSQGMGADEIIIVLATDNESAGRIEELLSNRLEYLRDSAVNYQPERLPIFDSAQIRRDGLTVAMLITENIDAAVDAYRASQSSRPQT